jgi:hypothetical protein
VGVERFERVERLEQQKIRASIPPQKYSESHGNFSPQLGVFERLLNVTETFSFSALSRRQENDVKSEKNLLIS